MKRGARSIACPTCGVPAGHRCTTDGGSCALRVAVAAGVVVTAESSRGAAAMTPAPRVDQPAAPVTRRRLPPRGQVVLMTACPLSYCAAQPGRPCTRRNRSPRRSPHQARYDAHEAATHPPPSR